MSAPNGFNEHASNLPDPGAAAAPIHMMRGGGGSTAEIPEQSGGVEFSMKDEAIFDEMGLNDSMITQHIDGFDDEFKRAFLRQYRSGECDTKGNSITNRDCWAYAKLVGALIKANITRGAATSLPGMVPEGNLTKVPTEPSPTAPIPPKIGIPTGVDPLANNENDDDTISDAARLAANAARLAAAADDDSLAPCIRGNTDISNREPVMAKNVSAAKGTISAEHIANMSTQAQNIAEALGTPEAAALAADVNTAAAIITAARDRGDVEDEATAVRRLIATYQSINAAFDRAIEETAAKRRANRAAGGPANRQKKFMNALIRPRGAAVPASRPATPPAAPPVPAPAASSTPSGRMDGSEYYFPPNAYSLALAENIARSTSSPTPPPVPAPTPSAAVALTEDYFLENPANFRKGQYGINLNTNASKRFYANAVVGTKRMRIRGRNAENIKRRYNTKKNALVTQANTARAARNAEIARATTERTRVNAARAAAASAASTANATAKRLRAERVAADKVVKQTTQTLRKSEKEVAEAARRAEVEAGIQKPSFMNRMRSIKNPFKRGGSRKTRRNTRRGNRR